MCWRKVHRLHSKQFCIESHYLPHTLLSSEDTTVVETEPLPESRARVRALVSRQEVVSGWRGVLRAETRELP